jgi:hypothetical protein
MQILYVFATSDLLVSNVKHVSFRNTFDLHVYVCFCPVRETRQKPHVCIWGRMHTASDRQVFVEMPSFDFLCTCVSTFDCSLWPCVYSDLDSAPNVLFPSTKHLFLL